MRLACALTISCVAAATALQADAPLFVIRQGDLPFDLGPGAPQNQPARPSNSPHAAANSAANAANRSTTYANSPTNPANERRVIYTARGEVVGYYAANGAGVLNLFDLGGRRVAYRPRGSKSLFSADGRWCGTVAAAQGGGFAFGMTAECARRF